MPDNHCAGGTLVRSLFNGPVRASARQILNSRAGRTATLQELALNVGFRAAAIQSRSPFATIVWDFIHRGMPLGREGSLPVDEVYALTAYLLALNKVIPEDTVLDKESLPKVKMPIGDDYARLPDWKPRTPRLQGYPY